MKTRECNYDLLRIICTVAVIALHISGLWIPKVTDEIDFIDNEIIIGCVYNVLSRFAVPCFVMLSGAFLLADERNLDYKYFYKKSFMNIGIQTIIFSLLYFCYSMLMAMRAVLVKHEDITALFIPLEEFIIGRPYYHLWYLYMLIGVYLIVPIILRFKKSITEKMFHKVAWIFIAVASASCCTSTYELNWDIGLSFEYVAYLMIGYVIRSVWGKRKSNVKGVFLILGGGISRAFCLCYTVE